MATLLYGYFTVWLLYCMATLLYGYFTVWLLYCMATLLYGYFTVWLLYSMGKRTDISVRRGDAPPYAVTLSLWILSLVLPCPSLPERQLAMA